MPHQLKKRRQQFLSTPSARRATLVGLNGAAADLFLSTPSARRATIEDAAGDVPGGISIHALREEGDASGVDSEGGREIFLSTPSARRATSS